MRKILALVMAAAVLYLASGCSSQDGSNKNKSTSTVPTAPQGVEVFGVVQPARSRHIVLDFSARIDEVLVKEGQRVKKGDVLVRYDPDANKGVERAQKSYLKENSIISDEDDAIVMGIGYLPGDTAGPAKSVLTLTSMRPLLVQANVLEEFIKDVKVGANVSILPVADKSKKYTGKVKAIGSAAFRQPNGETTIPVEVSLDSPDDFLLLGFNVQLMIDKS